MLYNFFFTIFIQEKHSNGLQVRFILLLVLNLTCVVLHHVLVVSVGGLGDLGQVHPHVHGRMAPGPSEQTEPSARLHHVRESQLNIFKVPMLVVTGHWSLVSSGAGNVITESQSWSLSEARLTVVKPIIFRP